jgi:hypothetical protein
MTIARLLICQIVLILSMTLDNDLLIVSFLQNPCACREEAEILRSDNIFAPL